MLTKYTLLSEIWTLPAVLGFVLDLLNLATLSLDTHHYDLQYILPKLPLLVETKGFVAEEYHHCTLGDD